LGFKNYFPLKDTVKKMADSHCGARNVLGQISQGLGREQKAKYLPKSTGHVLVSTQNGSRTLISDLKL
jgi:hypothetical protein